MHRSISLPLPRQVDASVEARAQGVTVFAVGVGNEITTSELVSIANRPSSTYVLYAQDYTTIHRIRDSMEQKLCEGRGSIRVCSSSSRSLTSSHCTKEAELVCSRLCD